MSADYPSAQEHFVPESFMFNSNARKAIVVHATGGDATPQAVYDTFIKSGSKSAHYAVGLDGTIFQYVPEARGAGANGIVDNTMDPFWQPYLAQYGNLNECTLSVEHCTASDTSSTPLTDAQKQASFALVSYLSQRYGIAPDHVKPHHSICSTACPGAYPMDELIAFLQRGGNNVGVPTGWHDDPQNQILTAPNGVIVKTGFREWILTHPWDPGDVPMATEYGANPVEVGYQQPSGPQSGTQQVFMYSALCWTMARNVYRASVGREFWVLHNGGKV